MVGGGYGGATVAQALDEWADVVLVEPKDAFVHSIAALRAAVRPEWVPKIFLPYDRLLRRGRIVRDRAVRVEPSIVTLGSGERLPADYVVLASGSAYPFPAKSDVDVTAAAQAKYLAAQENLRFAERVLILGAGPVGLELAGEILSEWPKKRVLLVDPAAELLSSYDPGLRKEIYRQLRDLGAELLLGSELRVEPPTAPGVAGSFTVHPRTDVEVTADIWFRCYGMRPVSDYLAGDLAAARLPNGRVRVSSTLQVEGQRTVFALGDITSVEEPKRAAAAQRHTPVIEANIRALAFGGSDLSAYEPGPRAILIPLGPTGGASQLPGRGTVGAAVTAQYKGKDLMLDRFAELLRLTPRRDNH